MLQFIWVICSFALTQPISDILKINRFLRSELILLMLGIWLWNYFPCLISPWLSRYLAISLTGGASGFFFGGSGRDLADFSSFFWGIFYTFFDSSFTYFALWFCNSLALIFSLDSLEISYKYFFFALRMGFVFISSGEGVFCLIIYYLGF